MRRSAVPWTALAFALAFFLGSLFTANYDDTNPGLLLSYMLFLLLMSAVPAVLGAVVGVMINSFRKPPPPPPPPPRPGTPDAYLARCERAVRNAHAAVAATPPGAAADWLRHIAAQLGDQLAHVHRIALELLDNPDLATSRTHLELLENQLPQLAPDNHP